VLWVNPIVGSALLWSICVWQSAWSQAQVRSEPPLRLSEPPDSIIADLESYIPQRMSVDDVPGLAVALIRGWKPIWTQGFGVRNVLTREPIDPDAVFGIASNSKVITAYVALSMASAEALDLDEPIVSQTRASYLPDGERESRITPRQLASHSSGLTDQILFLNKSVVFEPGSDYRYSGVGFLALQDTIEQVSGQELEQVARERLFTPLGMASTSYVDDYETRVSLTNGHIPGRVLLVTFFGPFVVDALVAIIIGVFLQRLITGRWRPSRTLWTIVFWAAFAMTALLQFLVLRHALPNFALASATYALFFALASWAIPAIGIRVMGRTGPLASAGVRRPWLRSAVVLVTVILLWWLCARPRVPVPNLLSPSASAVGSVKSSASDLAKFLIELGRPRLIDPTLAKEMRSSQITINDSFSWGLGPCIQHSEQGDALWQMGMMPGFRSVMVIYPDHGLGVVVLTNSSDGMPVAYDVAARALGGKSEWTGF
jgi:CubicO group peptidase (beta-lactamase class C family)